ncbi:hypothetical protein OH77DRAFT_1499623 [Trametes cingulata]|nr:hypothetical protein OH77DRAFT_1499623 [Trametes cingulata]
MLVSAGPYTGLRVQEASTSDTGNGHLRLSNEGGAGGPNANLGPNDHDAEIGGNVTESQQATGNVGSGQPGRTGNGQVKGRTRARFCLASLNVRGFGTTAGGGDVGKWLEINQLIRDRKVAHLNESRVRALVDLLFGQNLDIFWSQDESNPTGAKGVAFIVNKKVVRASDCKTREVVPGRAMLLELTILNVYGPNDRPENQAFWTNLLQSGLGSLDFILDSMDRLPPRMDPESVVGTLRELMRDNGMEDGWRTENPDKRGFSYLQLSTGSQSRIDRIYAKRCRRKDLDAWNIEDTGLQTDHRMVSVSVADKAAPYIGKGRWSMPTHLLGDSKMIAEMRKAATALIQELEWQRDRTPERNPQTAYRMFKATITQAARKRAKEKIPKIERQISRLKQDLEETLNRDRAPQSGTEEQCVHLAAILQERISKLEGKQFGWTRAQVTAKHWTQGETISCYWLRGIYTRHSKRMNR